ncbi:hypothetical protein Tco_0894732, partial [Tanacetum coccineum]
MFSTMTKCRGQGGCAPLRGQGAEPLAGVPLPGPFAPLNLTVGAIRVGQGPAIQPTSHPRYSQEPDPPKRSSSIRSNEKVYATDKNAVFTEEKEWSDGDLELLKKQMVKNPVGMPGRWEAVAEVFNGRHKVENVVKMAKSMGDKRMGGGDGDSLSWFLKDRKAIDKRVDEVIESEMEENKVVGNGGGGGGSWSSSEDIVRVDTGRAPYPNGSDGSGRAHYIN